MRSVFINDIITIRENDVADELINKCLTVQEKRKLDYYSMLSLAVAKKIYYNNQEKLDIKEDMSIVTSTCLGATKTLQCDVDKYEECKMVSPIFLTKILPNMQAATISIALNLKGNSYAIAAKESSSCNSIIDSYQRIRRKNDNNTIVVHSESVAETYGKNLWSCISKKKISDERKFAAAILLSHNCNEENKFEIVDAYCCKFSEKNMPPFCETIKNFEKNHGIYFPDCDEWISNDPEYLGARTICDIEDGINYSKKYNQRSFIVFTKLDDKFYSIIDIRCS